MTGGPAARVALRIAEVGIVLETDDPAEALPLEGPIRKFLVPVEPGPDSILVRVRRGHLTRPTSESVVYETGSTWLVSRPGGDWQFDFFAPVHGEAPYRSARFDESFSTGEVVFDSDLPRNGNRVAPLAYPLAELLIFQKTARAGGIVFHACGVRDEKGRGILFVGRSGDGKTTTARLWAVREGVTVLSDERIVVRPDGRGFRIWGTPWHGEGGYVDDSSAPLSAVFLLEHGPETRALALPEIEAITAMFPRCFPPFYDRETTERVLGNLSLLARSVPCFRLPFAPDGSAVDHVRRVVESLPV